MRREARGDELRADPGSRRGLLVGGIVAILAVIGAVWGLLTLRDPLGPRSQRHSELNASLPPGPETELPPTSDSSEPDTMLGPLSIPDGGWPEAPESLAAMDEIPSGTLQRGSAEEHGEEDETPADEVYVPAFFIDRYEVTNEGYDACVEDGVCRSPEELDPELFGSPRQPVVGVSWHDALTYCLWSGKRLPTEAEWERAARSDDRRLFPWGSEPPTCERAVFLECDRYGPAEVGGRPDGQGPFGTQDLSGNVWEWVQDWYAPRHFPAGPEDNPEGPPAGRQRVLRGGSWHFGAQYVRAANRHRDDPGNRSPWYGFRCAFRAPPPPPLPGPGVQERDAGLDIPPINDERLESADAGQAQPALESSNDSGI